MNYRITFIVLTYNEQLNTHTHTIRVQTMLTLLLSSKKGELITSFVYPVNVKYDSNRLFCHNGIFNIAEETRIIRIRVFMTVIT